ncbi:hypothetical protein QC760_005169 [Botrytis cinerea]
MSEPSKSRASFSDLPIELRLVIWNLAISPRAVVVQYNYTKKSCISKDIPSLLLVSREARAEALQKYEISFGTRSEVNSTIYFNYELDTVVFDWESFRDSYPSRHMSYHEECCRIKRIRVSDKTLDYLVKNGMRDLTTFKEVEEVSISGCYGGAVISREEYFLSRLSDWFMDDAVPKMVTSYRSLVVLMAVAIAQDIFGSGSGIIGLDQEEYGRLTGRACS